MALMMLGTLTQAANISTAREPFSVNKSWGFSEVANNYMTNVGQKEKLVFSQTDNLGFFLLDFHQTFASYDPPVVSVVEAFTIGGIWTVPKYVKQVHFTCHLDGVQVYFHNTAVGATVDPGFWSSTSSFPVPSVAPANTPLEIAVTGQGQSGETLFVVETSFSF